MIDGEVTLGEQLSMAAILAEPARLQNLLGAELGSERGFPLPEGPGTIDGDLYALGAILSFFVTGWNPIAGVAHDPQAVHPDLSLPMASVIRKSMSLIPAERYQTAEQFREDLEALSYDFAPLHAGQDVLGSSAEIPLASERSATAAEVPVAAASAQNVVAPELAGDRSATAIHYTPMEDGALSSDALPVPPVTGQASNGGSKAPLVLGILALLVAVGVGGWVVLQQQKATAAGLATVPTAPTAPTAPAGADTPKTKTAANSGVQTPSPAIAVPFVRPSWAADVGVDAYGAFAVLELGGARTKMRYQAPVTFAMGPSESGVVQQVTITRPYFMAESEMTQGQYEAAMGANPSHFKTDPALPVESISWHEAATMMGKLNQRFPGAGFSLPTEAQWESAARGRGEPPISLRAADGVRQTVPVTSGAISAAGFYGLTGNVLEWCADAYAPYSNAPSVVDPVQSQGVKRVARGGSWILPPEKAMATQRSKYPPDTHYFFLGIRLAAAAQAVQ
jgi:formylglycine-generating enzyme required for sulfatase activity